MSVINMGETSNTQEHVGVRDAYHVPGIAVVADQDVYPGESVRFTDEALTTVTIERATKRQAIVDPFLKGLVKAGTVFLALPVPGTTGNLRHNFDVKVEVKPAEKVDSDGDPITREYLRGAGEPGFATDDESEYALECKGCH